MLSERQIQKLQQFVKTPEAFDRLLKASPKSGCAQRVIREHEKALRALYLDLLEKQV